MEDITNPKHVTIDLSEDEDLDDL